MKQTTISLTNPSLPQSIQLAWNKKDLKCPQTDTNLAAMHFKK